MKTLLFTSIDGIEGEETEQITPERIAEIAAEYGFAKDYRHEAIPLAEAMNGQILFAEIITVNEKAMNLLSTLLFQVRIDNRDDWDKYIASTFPGFKQVEEQDSYLFETEIEFLEELLKEAQKKPR